LSTRTGAESSGKVAEIASAEAASLLHRPQRFKETCGSAVSREMGTPSAAASYMALPGHSPSFSIPTNEEDAAKGQLISHQLLLSALARGEMAIEVPDNGMVEQASWVYEHMRILCSDLGLLIGLLGTTGACSETTCPVMSCGEQQYLCASHPQPRECCAIDYLTHTLDAAEALLSSTWAFPSRVNVKAATAMPHFCNLARRLYRALSHAWKHHPEIYKEFETKTATRGIASEAGGEGKPIALKGASCTARFHALARRYNLLTEEQMVIR
jgi:Mob1/phocein family